MKEEKKRERRRIKLRFYEGGGVNGRCESLRTKKRDRF